MLSTFTSRRKKNTNMISAPKIWCLAVVVLLVYSFTQPPTYCSIVPLHPSLHLSSFPSPLLATLASFSSWWDVTSVLEWANPLWGKVFVCACACVGQLYISIYGGACKRAWEGTLHVWGPRWPADVTDFRIVLSQQVKRWFTCQGAKGQGDR